MSPSLSPEITIGSFDTLAGLPSLIPDAGPSSSNNSLPVIIPEASSYVYRPYQNLADPVSMSLGNKDSALMNSITPHYSHSYQGVADCLDQESLKSISLRSISLKNPIYLDPFQILDKDEEMLVKDVNHFLQNLGLNRSDVNGQTKVVSIVGNAGEGKSHALNHLFCGGSDVFRTTSSSGVESESIANNGDSSAVCGILSKESRALVLDTPGKTGAGFAGHKANRLAYKVMAVSDVIIYRTRSERLQSDVFEFLAGFCIVYKQYMKKDLLNYVEGSSEFVKNGPVLIICHDTRTARVITDTTKATASQQVADTAKRLGFDLDVFSRLTYIGSCAETRLPHLMSGMFTTSTSKNAHEAYIDTTASDGEDWLVRLKYEVNKELQSVLTRRSRKYSVVHNMLMLLNTKYSEEVEQMPDMKFPHYMFQCQERCKVCAAQCSKSMAHQHYAYVEPAAAPGTVSHKEVDSQASAVGTTTAGAGVLDRAHYSTVECKFANHYQNLKNNCTQCLTQGRKSTVMNRPYSSKQNIFTGIMTYTINGSVMECPTCGTIFTSRPSMVYSCEPDESIIEVEHMHVWPSERTTGYSTATHNARQVLEGFQATLTNVASQVPDLGFTKWISDKYINPSYWKADSLCTECDKCSCPLTAGIHHCRKCGLGFCEKCSNHRMQVPERNWGQQYVRVCVDCYNSPPKSEIVAAEEPTNTTRQVTETVYGFLSAATSTAAGYLRSSTRPDYWQADEEITECKVCRKEFNSVERPLHHCRDCGCGVCDACSPHRVPVKHRGWDNRVRVCHTCYTDRSQVQYQDM